MTTLKRQWRPGVAEQLRFYVYLLIDPRDGEPFYVGKGSGDRCFSHIREARESDADARRGYPKLAKIRDIEDAGYDVHIDILRRGLAEEGALEVESVAIDMLGMDGLANKVKGTDSAIAGRMTTDDVNALHGAADAMIEADDYLLLIRVRNKFYSGIPAGELYEATRKWGRVAPRRTCATHAMAVYAGVVRAVYRVDTWERSSASEVADDPKREGGWGFIGERDLAMEDRFLFTDATAYFSQGNQNPITYVNC
jgi:hypothetical protein